MLLGLLLRQSNYLFLACFSYLILRCLFLQNNLASLAGTVIISTQAVLLIPLSLTHGRLAAVPPGKYLAREEILTVVTLDLLGITKMSVEVSAGDVKLGHAPRYP